MSARPNQAGLAESFRGRYASFFSFSKTLPFLLILCKTVFVLFFPYFLVCYIFLCYPPPSPLTSFLGRILDPPSFFHSSPFVPCFSLFSPYSVFHTFSFSCRSMAGISLFFFCLKICLSYLVFKG